MPSFSEHNSAHKYQEYHPSVIRLLVGLCIIGLYIWHNSNTIPTWLFDLPILTGLGYIVISIGLFFLEGKNYFTQSKLRSAATVIDVAALSVFMAYGGEVAAPLCVIYYLLILINGLHRPSRAVWVTTSLSAIGFTSVLFINSYWGSQQYLGFGLLSGMVLTSLLISNYLNKYRIREAPGLPVTFIKVETKPSLQNPAKHDQNKLLLITPDSTDRHLLLNYIDSWGIKIDVCNSAVRAFAELLNAASRGAGYSIVIVDSINLDMEPIQFCKSLRSDNTLNHINLLHLSPGYGSDNETQLLDAGYSKVLKTPLDKTILFDALHATNPIPQENDNITQLIHHYESKDSSPQPSDILLATSDFTEQNNLKEILEQEGQRVYTVRNGSEALDALNTHQFDIVIIDFKMHDIKGKDVIRLYYYTYPSQDWIPFVALVDKATPEILSQCRETEVDAVLTRPIEKQKLLTTIADITTARIKQTSNPDSPAISTSSCSTSTTDGNSQVLNIQTLRQLEHLSPSDEFLDQLISRFDEDMVQLLDTLKLAIENNQYSEFMDQSHALRDSSCNIGADLLHHLSLQALQISQHEFKKQGKLILDELNIAQAKTKYALHNYVIQRNNSATETE